MLTHAKSTVRAILDNFKVWLSISPERIISGQQLETNLIDRRHSRV